MRKQFIINLSIFITCLLVDQLSKYLALKFLPVHYNYGVFLGFLTDTPASFRVITLATTSAFLFFIYVVFLYLLPTHIPQLKTSLSLIIGGILGNVTDRLIHSKTIDFIPAYKSSFNIADIFLFAGIFYFIYLIFKFDHEIWHPENSRNNYLVNPKEQLKLALKFSLASLGASLLLGFFAITFLKTHFSPAALNNNSSLNTFIIAFALLALLFAFIVFLVGIVISHRTAGPLYAFEMHVEKLLEGKNESLSLRDGDNYRHFEEVAEKLRSNIFKD
jgi:signal peptidase II